MKLCEALGYPHPDYLLPYLTAEHLTDWAAYFAGDDPESDDPATWSPARVREERAKLEERKRKMQDGN